MATLRQPAIPGMSVTEMPMDRATERQFIRDPGPGNPRVGATQGVPSGQPAAQMASAPGGARGSVDLRGPAGGAVPGGAANGSPRPGGLGRVTGAVKQFVGGGSTNVGGAARSVGTDLLRTGGRLLKAPAAAALALGAGAKEGLDTDTETYRNRFNLQTDDPSVVGDLGVRALGVASDVVNSASFGGLRKLQDSIYGEGQWDGKNTAAPAPGATRPQATPTAPRYSFPNTAGAGRGSAADPNRTDVDPTSPAFGAARDMSRELASVPRDLPSDLRQGVIFKTTDANGRTVYSGSNVGADAPMVDGMGRTLRGGGGTVSTVPGMSREEIAATLARPAPGAVPAGGQGGGMVASGGLFDTPRARRQAEALRLTERGQDLNFSATTRGQDIGLQATRETIGERRDARLAEIAARQGLRGATARFMEQANGNPAVAADLALRAGFSDLAKDFGEQATTQNTQAVKRREAVLESLKPISTTIDKDGKGVVDEALLQRNMAALEGIARQLGKSSVEDLMADGPSSRAAVKLLQGLNARNQSFTDVIGLTEPTQRRQLPNLRGAQSEGAGVLRAVGPGVQLGDRRLVTSSGNLYIPEDVFADEEVQTLLGDLMKQPK